MRMILFAILVTASVASPVAPATLPADDTKPLCYCEWFGPRRFCHYETPPPPRQMCQDEA